MAEGPAARQAKPPAASGRPLRRLMGVTVLILAGVLLLGGIKTWRDLRVSRTQLQELEQEIADKQERIEALKARIQRLEEDPQTLERRAREDLGLVRPADVIFVLPEEAPAEPP